MEDGQFKFANFAVTGYPKHDVLFRRQPRYESVSTTRVYDDETTRWILYIPSRLENAGADFDAYFPEEDLVRLNSILERYRAELLIKPHPADRPFPAGHPFTNISFLGSRDDIYPILSQMDLLITDYSSTLYAAAHVDLPVVVHIPEWHGHDPRSQLGSLITRRKGKLRPDFFELFDVPVTTSPEQLSATIERHLDPVSDPIPPMDGRCKDYVDFTDGESSRRVADLVKSL
jgi:CDP-glycerol glycerophosphotransferase (TagB/SpsB family)